MTFNYKSKVGIIGFIAAGALLASGCATNSAEIAEVEGPQEFSVELPESIAEAGEFTVGIRCDYPPFGFEGIDQEPQGIEVDIAREMAKYAFGTEDAISLQCTKAADRVPYLESDRVDFVIAALGVTPEREEVIGFTDPYFASTTVFLAKKDVEFDSFEDVQNEDLILLAGTPWIPWLETCEPDVNLSQYPSLSDAIAALQAGRGIASLGDSTQLFPVAEANDDLHITGPSVDEQGYFWSIGVKQDDDELREWLNAGLEKMQQEDFFADAIDEWVESEDIKETLYEVIPRPDQNPDYQSFQASLTDDPSCP